MPLLQQWPEGGSKYWNIGVPLFMDAPLDYYRRSEILFIFLFFVFYRPARFMGDVKSQRLAFQDLGQRAGSRVFKSCREAL